MASIIRTDALQNLNTSNIISQTNATTLTIGASGQTISIPAGATILNNGTATNFGQTYNGAVSWTSNIVTSALTVSAGVGYFVNTSSAAITATLPASPTVGATIAFSDYNRTFGTNALTLNRNGNNFQGAPASPSYNTNGQSITITYADSTKGWIPIVDDDAANKVSYSIDFLVVAGGGGGSSGGGGAGGYRTSTQSPNVGTVITVTVGDGGAAGNTSPNAGSSGSNSSISGSGLTTITSAGGGGGRQTEQIAGIDGGSGGGGGASNDKNTQGGFGNTPSVSPSQGNNGGSNSNIYSPYPTGGGGGANAVGGSASGGSTSGNGGAGTASSITGSSVTYAGGGGGGNYFSPGTPGSGGSGGGGGGAVQTGTATAGTVNLGGGGGGTGVGGTAGSGGKGVVILSVPTASYSGTTTGSPTITTSGSNTILKFTGSGSYTV